MEAGDTTKTVDQGVTAGSRTIERAGPQLRQAAAAARQQLLKMAAARLAVPVDQLTVTDGVVSVMGNGKKMSYGNLVGGKPFNVQIPATGVGWDLKVAPDVHAKNPNDYKIVGTSVPRVDLPTEVHSAFHLHAGRARARDAARPRGAPGDGRTPSPPAWTRIR